jgi:photosystem II stability/assembly factor-like uncharacterized protein
MHRSLIISVIPLLLASLVGGTTDAAGGVSPAPAIHRGPPAVVRMGRAAGPAVSLTSAAFPTSQTGFVAGTEGTGLAATAILEGTRDGGRRWQVLFRRRGLVLGHLAFSGPRTGWAIGGPAEAPSTMGFGGASVPSQQLWQTTDGGASWSLALTVSGAITGLAVGGAGAPWVAVAGPCGKMTCRGKILARRGSQFPLLWRAPGPVLALARRGTTGWAEVAVEGSGPVQVELLKTTDGGRSWAVAARLPAALGRLPLAEAGLRGALQFSSRRIGLASVFALGSCSMGGCGVSAVLRTTNGGASWTPVKAVAVSCAFRPLLAGEGRAAAVIESVNLAACAGPGTTLFLSVDGGARFRRAASWPETSLIQVGYRSGGGLWALTPNALITSENGGMSWRQAYPAVSPTGVLSFVNQRVAYAAGDQADPGAILRSQDGGRTWQVVGSLAARQAVQFAFSSPTAGWAGAIPLQGQYHTGAVLLHTTDGGRHWTTAFAPHSGTTLYPAIRFFTAQRGLFLNLPADCPGTCPLFGATTVNGGRTWTPLASSSAPANIASAAILSPSRFVVDTLGTISVPGGVYETANGGRTWTELLKIPSTLNGGMALSFPTPQVGYLVVNDVKKPVDKSTGTPQQAVLALLKTTNGGRSWTLADLPGIPDDWFATVSFRNREDGYLVADQRTWRTADGGAVWVAMP